MISTTVFPGRYIQGYDAIRRLGKEMACFGEKGLIVCDPYVYDNILPRFKADIDANVRAKYVRFGGECSDEEVARLKPLAAENMSDFVVGMGGGKTLDTAKMIGNGLRLPVACCPTIASTDAPCSAVAIIYTKSGEYLRTEKFRKNPDVVLVDSRIVVQAPVRFLVAGFGDALSTWFEAESCARKYAPNSVGDIGSLTAVNLARLCYDTIRTYGAKAKMACEVKAVTPAFEHVVEANVLLSGLGFESVGLATAHAIHNGLTMLGPTHKYFHGEKVAIGTLASLFLTDKSSAMIDEVYDFCQSVGLPMTFADIGLTDVAEEDLEKVAAASCAQNESIFNESIPVTKESIVFALKACDAEGRRRKAQASRAA